MYFDNLNFLYIFFLLLWIIFIVIYMYFIYKNNKDLKANLFLSISWLLVLINILWIKTNLVENKATNVWWRILFVLDLSKSMETLDVWDSRLDLSKQIISDFIIENSQNKNALMGFAWEVIEVLPFTDNSSIFVKILNWLDNNNIWVNWTNLTQVFEKAYNYFKEEEAWTIVVFTDWWDEEINIDNNIIKSLKNRNINILIVWVWTEKWWYIPDWIDVWWNINYKIYNWQRVVSKLNENELSKFGIYDNISYVNLDAIKDFNNIENKINKLVIEDVLTNNEANYLYLTRFIIFFAFISFLLFLVFDNKLIWKK